LPWPAPGCARYVCTPAHAGQPCRARALRILESPAQLLVVALANTFRNIRLEVDVFGSLARGIGSPRYRKYVSRKTSGPSLRIAAGRAITRTSRDEDIRAQALHAAFLQHAQVCLQRKGRSPISSETVPPWLLKTAAPLGHRESPFSCPKVIFDQRFRKGAGGDATMACLRVAEVGTARATTPCQFASPVISTLVSRRNLANHFVHCPWFVLPRVPPREGRKKLLRCCRSRTEPPPAGASMANFKACTSRVFQKSAAPCCNASNAFLRRLSQPNARPAERFPLG